jgi:hypothetical protein
LDFTKKENNGANLRPRNGTTKRTACPSMSQATNEEEEDNDSNTEVCRFQNLKKIGYFHRFFNPKIMKQI